MKKDKITKFWKWLSMNSSLTDADDESLNNRERFYVQFCESPYNAKSWFSLIFVFSDMAGSLSAVLKTVWCRIRELGRSTLCAESRSCFAEELLQIAPGWLLRLVCQMLKTTSVQIDREKWRVWNVNPRYINKLPLLESSLFFSRTNYYGINMENQRMPAWMPSDFAVDTGFIKENLSILSARKLSTVLSRRAVQCLGHATVFPT